MNVSDRGPVRTSDRTNLPFYPHRIQDYASGFSLPSQISI